MKRALSILAIVLAPIASAHSQSYLKVNAASTLLGVPGVGYERTLSEHWSFQFDATVSPWRSVGGAPLKFAILIPEWRYHPRGVTRGVYVGAHAGASVFQLQKWDHRNTTQYEEGFGLLLGLTFGYQRPLNESWLLDLFAGGGTSQALYKGYDWTTGTRTDGAKGWNKSGEWVPYRGGVMFSRRFGRTGHHED